MSSFVPKWSINSSTGHVKLAKTRTAETFLSGDKTSIVIHGHCFEEALAIAGGNLGDVVTRVGQYASKSFDWILENDPGYVNFLARQYHGVVEETVVKNTKKYSWQLVNYAKSFPQFAKTTSDMRVQEDADHLAKELGDDSVRMIGFGQYSNRIYRDV